MILWSLLFAGKQALSNVKNVLPMLVATFLLNGGLNQAIFLLLFLLLFSFVLFVRGSDFFWVAVIWCFSSFVLGWFLCWCILVPPCVHCFSVHCYRALLLLFLFSTCPHRRKHLLSNLKIISEEKQASNGNAPSRSAPSGSAPRPPEEDGRKRPAATGL